jgi:hypothetical protein
VCRDEVKLRAHGNITLQANIDFMTLYQWYNLFNITGTKEIYLKVPPGVKNGSKGSSFCLELFIHEDIVSFHFLWKETKLELIIRYFCSTMNEQVRMKMMLNTLPSGHQQ